MRSSILIPLVFALACASSPKSSNSKKAQPAIWGEFQDDYGIRYHIDEKSWHQVPDAIYHVHKWDFDRMFLIAQNDESNPSEPGLWTRIDWVDLPTSSTYPWAYCLTTYNAASAEEAEAASANREEPRTGCNGFPFSRMR